MDPFEELQVRAMKLSPAKVKIDLFAFIRTLETELARLNVEALNIRSQDIDGNPIGFYSYATEIITSAEYFRTGKGRIKAKGEPFDLEVEGIFLKSIFAKVENDSIFFDATDKKKNEVLKNVLSVELFGLQDDVLNKVIEEKLLPFFIEYLTNEMLLD